MSTCNACNAKLDCAQIARSKKAKVIRNSNPDFRINPDPDTG